MTDQLKQILQSKLHDIILAANDEEIELLEMFGNADIILYVKNNVDSSGIDYLLSNVKHREWVSIKTNNLDKLRMLEYLKDNVNNITLEDLETIVNNK